MLVSEKEEAKLNVASGNLLTSATLLTFLKHKCFFIQNRDCWIIDTGATDHICMLHMPLSNKQKLKTPILVKLAIDHNTIAYH